MAREKNDPQGSVPDKCEVALLIVDVINDLEFEGGEALAEQAVLIVENIAELKRRAKLAGVPVVYVNDNFGKWQSNFQKLIDRCIGEEVRGKPIARRLLPEADDYFVLKPKHSGFYSTTLELLLSYLGSRILILTGLTGDNCILFTAGDAHVRDYRLAVPSDCVASESAERNQRALKILEEVLKADVRPSSEIDFKALLRKSR
jgi:nicotinamidase-related amidase